MIHIPLRNYIENGNQLRKNAEVIKNSTELKTKIQ